MAQQMRITGWLDPERPGRWKSDGPCEFRLKLSEVPSTTWRTAYSEQARNDSPNEVIDRDVVILVCQLSEIESAVKRLRRCIEHANQTSARLEHEANDRVTTQKRVEEEQRLLVLQAVGNIRFGSD